MTIPDGYTDLPPGKIAAVVTYLEMRRPPEPFAPCTAPAGIEMRRVERPDPVWYRRLFRSIGEDWLWFSRLQASDEDLRAVLHHPDVDIFVLSHNGTDHGLLELDRRHGAEIEIAFFGVTAQLVGRGAGRFLMCQALEIAWACEAQRLTVHTCTLDHPRALGFYLRSGFTAYKRAIEIVDDPRLTGALPRTAAPFVPLIA